MNHGAIKFKIVQTLPTTEIETDAIYLVPITPDEGDNNYAEYIYVNGAWEELGKIAVHVDLRDYVKNTDYATASVGGVIKSGWYNLSMDNSGHPYASTRTYAQYQADGNSTFIGKGTLDNVLNAIVGDISSALDAINGEVV